MYNKKRTSLLKLLVNSIVVRSAPQVLSLKDEYTFCVLIFVIIGFCNFSANCYLSKSKARY